MKCGAPGWLGGVSPSWTLTSTPPLVLLVSGRNPQQWGQSGFGCCEPLWMWGISIGHPPPPTHTPPRHKSCRKRQRGQCGVAAFTSLLWWVRPFPNWVGAGG